MNRVAIAFSTCDRTELTRRSIEPLLQPDKFDLHWIDGSKTEEGIYLQRGWEGCPNNVFHPSVRVHPRIRGGSGPAIVYALSTLLSSNMHKSHPDGNGRKWWFHDYTHVGLVENDVLLDQDFFEPMMHLFARGKQDGLRVGAVSARSYEDRVLIQRDGYAVMHNLGAGMIMFTREAAEIVLQHYRTVWTAENRLLFSQLSGIDIGRYWAFRGEQHWLVADWNFDRVLASHGLASLALTPNRATMLDQDIAPLGLKYADGNSALARNQSAFETYRDNLAGIRAGRLRPGINHPFYHDGSSYTIFAHQVPMLGGSYSGDWRVRDFQGFGPFVWRADDIDRARVTIPIVGPCDLIVSGGKSGGTVHVVDKQSGFSVDVPLAPETDQGAVMQLSVPGAAAYRNVVLTAKSPGVCFFGVRVREPQPWLTGVQFDHSVLPPV